MSEVRIYPYEGLFLFPQSAASNLIETAQSIIDILDRAEAELLGLQKWDERNLAYEIRKQKRGVYILAYFKARGTQVANIERDCNLSETILRFIITRCDNMTEEQMRAADDRDSLRIESKLRATGDEEGESNEPAMAGAMSDGLESGEDLED